DAAARLYAEDASTHLGHPATGAEAVREALAGWIGSLDGVRLGLSDFDASGSMSYGAVHIVVDAVDSDDDGDGTLVFVLKKRGRDWEIRSQTLVMNR
ncbi:MAG: hypothetical protein GWM90_06255, partial [Gemmatimonadetes bacterium]|nr:hypothetical protein [Gemmatimonadota bacterium]NIQ53374.1 hypothetical protein [Gemmatimonadota bacterium]NIU73517.1 hypothetical protein [Gammaproteobacteria bacterium]NIX43726.1 hypothetical protein [Gemmatimonadota bacterium]NIY07919.1 hypothetical protein [Gemmatimonadota bacterium]